MRKGGLESSKKWWWLKPGLAKRRALFPEGRGLGVGGRKRENEKGTGRASVDGHRSIRKDGSNQTANFTKPNIILILADDVEVY